MREGDAVTWHSADLGASGALDAPASAGRLARGSIIDDGLGARSHGLGEALADAAVRPRDHSPHLRASTVFGARTVPGVRLAFAEGLECLEIAFGMSLRIGLSQIVADRTSSHATQHRACPYPCGVG